MQLVHQVKQAMRLGLLEVGDKLPTAREVVEKLAINPNTVLKAYRELEREGLVRGRPGMGTFVERSVGGTNPADRMRLRRGLAAWVRQGLEALFASVIVDTYRVETA